MIPMTSQIISLLGIASPGYTPEPLRTITVNATFEGEQTTVYKEAMLIDSASSRDVLVYFPLRDGKYSSRTFSASAIDDPDKNRVIMLYGSSPEDQAVVSKSLKITSDLNILLDLSENGGGIVDYPLLTGIGKLSGFFDLQTLPESVNYSDITIIANYRDPLEGTYNGLQAGKTNCNPDGSWAIEGLNEAHRYNVVMSIPTFNDITYSNKDTSDSTYVPVGDPYWKNVVALLHFDESLTKNEAGSNFLVYGNPQPVEGKFGDALYGDGSHGVIGEGIDFILGSQDFTIECFWKPVGINRTAFSFNAYGSTAHTVYQFHQGLSFWNGGSNLIISNVIVPSSDFSHIAFVRRNSVALLFLNGILVGSAPYALELNNNNLRTGNVTPTNPGGGAIDEFRVTKGVARYTENFTPPDKPFLNHLPR